MTDPELPDDPFTRGLGDRLRDAADHLDGAGVTHPALAGRSPITARRPVARRWAVAVAAALVLGGLAVVAVAHQDRGSSQTVLASEPTAGAGDPCASHAIGWVRLTGPQAIALARNGSITEAQRADRAGRAVLITNGALRALAADGVPLDGEQIWDLRTPDGLALRSLADTHPLTSDQQDDLAAGAYPVLTQAQVDDLLTRDPSLRAVPAGGDAVLPVPPQQVAPARDESADATTTTWADGQTPFDQWVQLLRDEGLLTPDQEAEIAAGRGISLTAEQSAVLQEHWTGTSSTSAPTTTTDPCAGQVDGSATTTTMG